jgi:hypothetical protein
MSVGTAGDWLSAFLEEIEGLYARAGSIMPGDLHDYDFDRIRRVGEGLHDIASGRSSSRDEPTSLTRTLMGNLLSDGDGFRSYSDADVCEVVDRLIPGADSYYFSAGYLAEGALRIIAGSVRQ